MISVFEEMVLRASSRVGAREMGAVLVEEEDAAVSGMMRSWLLWIHT